MRKIWQHIKNLFILPPKERPVNWPDFLSGVYIALYVALIIYSIDLFAKLVTYKNNVPLEEIQLGFFKIICAGLALGIFGAIKIQKIRKEKKE